MAMRRYTQDELESELKDKWKLTPTEEYTATTRAWKTPNGNHLLVPMMKGEDRCPDHVVDRLVDQLNTFGENPFKRQAP